jgi:hypothetical protein
MTHHVVMFSGGLGSWATARLALRKAAPGDRLTLLFADVKGDSDNPHDGEDEDTYRFIADAAVDCVTYGLLRGIHTEYIRVADGRTIWQVFKDDRFLGNSRLANCSKYLKQIPCREWLDANVADPADAIVYVGIDWTETHRLPAIVRNYLPYRAVAPLTEPPHYTKEYVREWAESEGLTIPRLYRAGFPHNNCGGGCVRAGQAQFALLLREHPERFHHWEDREQELRDHLDADVAILRDRTGGTSTPLTLRSFREGIEAQTQLFDPNDFGGCGCFVDSPEAIA